MRYQSPSGSPQCTSNENWIDGLASSLPNLANIQKPYLQASLQQNPKVHRVYVNREEIPPSYPLGDLRILYSTAYHSNAFGNAEYFAPLREALDPVRHIIRSHPTLAQVVSQIIGKDEFWMQVLNSGLSTSPSDLIAGLMARAAELSGDRFRTAAEELNGLLLPIRNPNSAVVPGELDAGYDAVLFYGLNFQDPIEIADGLVVLTSEMTRRFVDEEWIDKHAPRSAAYHGWKSIGSVVRPFRWRPMFCRSNSIRERSISNPKSFYREASVFVDLLAVAHATPILPVAVMSNRIDRSAGRLLGLEEHNGDVHLGRSMHSFDGFDECPEPAPEALTEAMNAFKNRKSDRFTEVVWIVSRLSDALVNDGRFSDEDRIVTVVKTLERMYELPDRNISSKLQNRACSFLETDFKKYDNIKAILKKIYDLRSNITHGWVRNLSLHSKTDVFVEGFDLARRTLFKLLREGPPKNWDNLSRSNS